MTSKKVSVIHIMFSIILITFTIKDQKSFVTKFIHLNTTDVTQATTPCKD